MAAETPLDEHDERNFEVPDPGTDRPPKKARRTEAPEAGPTRTVDEDGNVTVTDGRNITVTDRNGNFTRASQSGGPPATDARNRANPERLRAQMRARRGAPSQDEPDAKRKRSEPEDDDAASVHLIMALIKSGVDYDLAKKKVKHMFSPTEGTFLELYGRGGITDEDNGARRGLNIKGLGALDLHTIKPDGSMWDFRRRADRREALEMVDELQPNFVIGSPPCTAYCSWNRYMNYPKMKKEVVDCLIEEGKLHLDFMMKVYKKQVDAGRYFLHEHPATALSWHEKSVLSVAMLPGVEVTTADQCMYGLKTKSDNGGTAPAMKPTKFMTKCWASCRSPSDLL